MIKLSILSEESLQNLLSEALDFANGKVVKAKSDVFVANLFFEDSTRTKVSFEVAEKKLGLHIVNFDEKKSSINKGETLLDTIKTLDAIGVDLVVVRHEKTRYYDELKGSSIGLVNAGDGVGHHPSQGLLDLMTIVQEFGDVKGLKVAIVGDIKHSRVANSNAHTLRRLGAKVFFSGPREWFDEGSLMNGTYMDLDALIPEVDVLMMLRIQHERHNEKVNLKPEDYLKKYGLTKEREARMKPNAIIMHPAPINRGVEIDNDLVECERSRIFKQMKNGVFARMAILKKVLERKGFEFE